MKRLVFSAFLMIVGLPVLGFAQDIAISAQASPQQVNVGENIRLLVLIEGQVNINGSPTLPDLSDFQVYSGGRSSNFTFVNGQVSSSLQYTYILVPKHAGTLTIGAVTLVYNNKTYSTSPIQISVGGNPAANPQHGASPSRNPGPTGPGEEHSAGAARHAQEPVFITTQVDRHEAYVNEPIKLTFKFFHRIPILAQPQYQPPSTSGFWSEDLPPQSEYITTLNGTEFQVTEVKTALFPTTAGKLTIGPATLLVQVEDFSRRTMDPFADEFFRNFFSGGKQVALKSDPIQVMVKPIPTEKRPPDFSGTVGKWSLSARLDRQTANVGDAVTLEIRIFGEGNVKSVGKIDLPPISGFKIYDTISSSEVQKQDGRVRGVKTYRTLLRPEVSGDLTLPPIGYAYFDPKSAKFERIQVPGLKLKVLPGSAPAAQDSVLQTGALATSALPAGPGVKLMTRDIRYLKINVPLTGKTKSWPWEFWALGFGLPPIALAAAWLWRRERNRLQADPRYARRISAVKSAKAALRQAHDARAHAQPALFYSALSQALSGYLTDRMGLSRTGVTQREIAQRLEKLGAEANQIKQLTELWDECDFARFAPGERNAADMAQHEQLAEALLTEFIRVLEKEGKA